MKGQAQVVEAFILLQSLSLICTCENGHVATIVWIHPDTLTVSLEPTLLRWSVRILLGHLLKNNVGSWVCVPTSLRPKQGNWSERQTIEWISNEPNFITYSVATLQLCMLHQLPKTLLWQATTVWSHAPLLNTELISCGVMKWAMWPDWWKGKPKYLATSFKSAAKSFRSSTT